MHAEEVVALLTIFDESGNVREEPLPIIRDLLARYPSDDDPHGFTAAALVVAARLARETECDDLLDELLDRIERKFLQTSGAVSVLIDCERPPLFHARMTLLDGKTLRFPEDTKGKIVVIDYWATWCVGCLVITPQIKALWIEEFIPVHRLISLALRAMSW